MAVPIWARWGIGILVAMVLFPFGLRTITFPGGLSNYSSQCLNEKKNSEPTADHSLDCQQLGQVINIYYDTDGNMIIAE